MADKSEGRSMKIALKILILVMAFAAVIQVVMKNHHRLTASSQVKPEVVIIAGEGSPGP